MNMRRVWVAAAVLAVSATACGQEVGALSEPRAQPSVIEQEPQLDCLGEMMVRGVSDYLMPEPGAKPISPRAAMARRLRGTETDVDDLTQFIGPRDGRTFTYEFEGRVVGVFNLREIVPGRWIVGGEGRCADGVGDVLIGPEG